MTPNPSPEIYAKCPHCGEMVSLSALSLRLYPAPPARLPTPSGAVGVPSATPTAEPEEGTVPGALAPIAPEPQRVLPERPVARPPGAKPSPAKRAGWRNLLPVRIWKRYFPPVRLVWIFLVLILWNVDGFVSKTVALPLLLLPAVAAAADVGLQLTRFPKVRIPDAAIANGFFLSLILWPTTISIELAAVAVATVGIRHLIRLGGHPVFNPAAVGVAIAAVVFALPQPWHVGLTLNDSILLAVLGLILWSRARHTWRLWGVYFAVNIAATLLLAYHLAGSSVLPLVIQTSVLGAAPIFYGFFMVTEPRTAPSARWAMIVFGALVGVSNALLPMLLAQNVDLAALGVLTPYLALFLGNGFAVALPSARGARRPAPAPSRAVRPATARRAVPEP